MFKYFNELKEVIEELGFYAIPGDIAVPQDRKELSGVIPPPLPNGPIIIEPKPGLIARGVLHICDIDTQWIYRKSEKFKQIIKSKDFDNLELVKLFHKYHFSNCRILQEMFEKGFKKRYNATRRWGGEFLYYIIENNKVIYKNENQRLLPCKYCLDNLEKITGRNYIPEKFDIKEALKISSELPPDHKWECEHEPNIYPPDWPHRAEKLKEAKNYTCEDCKVNLQSRKKDCHVHHVNSIKSDNQVMNLKVLCVDCHNEKHSHNIKT